MTATKNTSQGRSRKAPAATVPTVLKYGATYPCEVLRSTPTRHLVRFTQSTTGKTVDRWVSHDLVTGYTPPAAPVTVGDRIVKKLDATPAPAAPRRNAERRNEQPHPDAVAAVALYACSSCKARKGKPCTARSGEPTKHVHAPRLARFGANTPEAGPST